ncbi:TetR/AcrR family transcriptional regulator [Photorhabdus aegyptia]|uniref:Transcriptional regulator, TetR family n=1 Tax=Photorhabdus aegyptia TaxID=2805098 RepID=A0A022PI32_9GAMM|nr:TetR/AcrR family transcriptional regulator [Photorhabdus aegyptia]EYU15194.1 transcriptional regulator, TetR family [Photorhabdus aegyptia]
MTSTPKAQTDHKRTRSYSRISGERVNELLKIAAQVFAERGFDGASINEMAKRANASKGTYYSRFPSKEELLVAVVRQRIEEVEVGLDKTMNREPDIGKALTIFAEEVLTAILSETMIANYRVVTLESQRFPQLGKIYYEKGVKKIVDFLVEYLVRKMKEGKLNIVDPKISAEVFIDGIIGTPRLKATLGIGLPTPEEKSQRIAIAVQSFLAAYGIASCDSASSS